MAARTPPRCRAFGVLFAAATFARAAARITHVDASPAVDDALPAVRVTVAEGVPWGVTRCAAPRDRLLCAKAPPREGATQVRVAEGPESVALPAIASGALPTAWLVVVDAGAPIAPRWADVRVAAAAWAEAVPRPGDRVAVLFLGETRHVSRSPWFSYEDRARALEALGFQALPLMPLGRDAALGPVFRAAVEEAIEDLPSLPTARDVGRVVAGLFTDGRTATAQQALEAHGAQAAVEPRGRTRLVEVEAFWFPHDATNPRADGSGGLLDVAGARGRVHRFDGPVRDVAVSALAEDARGPSERAARVQLDLRARDLLPGAPALELVGAHGGAVDRTPAWDLALGPEGWPLPAPRVEDEDLPDLFLGVPLAGERPRRWRVFWLPSEDTRVVVPAGRPVRRADLEALVATDHELPVRTSEGRIGATLDAAALVARASGPLSLVVYDDVSRRATPLRHDRAPHVAKGTWAAPLVDGPRVLRLAALVAGLAALSLSARARRRRAAEG